MRRYRAYGLIFDCERELPFAAADSDTAADVTIRVALGQPPAAPSAELYRELRREGTARWSLRYHNPDGGWLHFDHDAEAKALAVGGSVDWSDAVPVLAGVACAVLLSSAGTPLLHGAAVAFEGGAIGLLGDSGQGKSTLAAALLKAGGRLLSEDLLAFTRRGPDFAAEPGYARISLLPDACHALGFEGGESAPAQPRDGTAKCWIGAAAAAGPVGIRSLYILAPSDPAAPDGRAERLSRAAAAPALVRHLYGATWIRPVREPDLAFCGSLAAAVPVFTLSRPESLARAEACAAMLRNG
jgi:hypothetical protein